MTVRRIRQLLVIALAFLCGAILAMLVLPRTPRGADGGNSFGTAAVGGPFRLLDHTGRRVGPEDFRGRFMLIYFGFTLCPDICPAGLQVMTAALDRLGPLADQIAPIFITLDAQHDTPAVMADYVKSFSPRLIGLTGTEVELEAAARAYHVYHVRKSDPKSTLGYVIDHTALFYVMGPDGSYVTLMHHTTSAEEMAQQLARSLELRE